MSGRNHVVTLELLHAAGHQLHMRYHFNEHHFSTSYWYDFDLKLLEAQYGSLYMEQVYFHCAAFDINKLCSLKPDVVDWGAYARWHTPDFERVWRQVVQGVFAQWHYENNLPPYQIKFASEAATTPVSSAPATIDAGAINTQSTLAFNGGGKDSLVMLQLLAKADISYSTLSYSHSVYGQAAVQHERSAGILELLPSSSQACSHRLTMISDFLDSPVLESLGKDLGIKTILAAETPASIFAALPILLHYGYTDIVFAHERSANTGNLTWEEAAMEINHQWGKSEEAEVLLHSYVRAALISNASIFSLLQPIHDVVIFNIAGTCSDAIIHTQSCNVAPPWCTTCPKCCYVWLNFTAYISLDLVHRMFSGKNLLNFVGNQIYFKEMMGLGAKKPFECIGEIDEVKLALEVCRHRGVEGQAMELYKEQILPSMNAAIFAGLVERYTRVHPYGEHVPLKYRGHLQSALQQAGRRAKEKLLPLFQ